MASTARTMLEACRISEQSRNTPPEACHEKYGESAVQPCRNGLQAQGHVRQAKKPHPTCHQRKMARTVFTAPRAYESEAQCPR